VALREEIAAAKKVSWEEVRLQQARRLPTMTGKRKRSLEKRGGLGGNRRMRRRRMWRQKVVLRKEIAAASGHGGGRVR
jgi:hypothetical protein